LFSLIYSLIYYHYFIIITILFLIKSRISPGLVYDRNDRSNQGIEAGTKDRYIHIIFLSYIFKNISVYGYWLCFPKIYHSCQVTSTKEQGVTIRLIVIVKKMSLLLVLALSFHLIFLSLLSILSFYLIFILIFGARAIILLISTAWCTAWLNDKGKKTTIYLSLFLQESWLSLPLSDRNERLLTDNDRKERKSKRWRRTGRMYEKIGL
jgi:hypothetical protein